MLGQCYNPDLVESVTMATGLDERPTMAKREEAAPKRNDVPVKVDIQVVADARIAAAYKGLSLAEYISETLRPLVAKDIEDSHAQRSKQAKPKSAK
jgi:hypothetical protein